ncbi:MAG: prepilin peptidase [Burkholderiaceae bacterium]|jgi:prepilin peptidase CpaA|nr:prepilin peptidase [Burkholderiaceae bacterium]
MMLTETTLEVFLWSGRIALPLLLVIASATDLVSRRIPNWLPLSGLLFALAWHSVPIEGGGLFDSDLPGAVGFINATAGAFTCLVVFLLFYALRVMGAGDAKLMTAVGGFFGFPAAIGLILAVLLAGGVLAIARMAVAGTARGVWRNLQTIAFAVAVPGVRLSDVFDPATQSADRMPYALAIAAGTILYGWAKWAGWISLL